MSRCSKQNNDIKIKHITYDQTHRRQATGRPSAPSASQNMAVPSTSRPRRHLEEEADEERPVIMWLRTDASPQKLTQKPVPEVTTFLTLERRLEKEAREKAGAKTPKNKPTPIIPIYRPKEAPSPPPLRRKPNFSESLRECLGNRKPTAEITHHKPEVEGIERVHILRDRIREGKLEKIIPPPRVPGTEGRVATSRSKTPTPPRTSHNKLPRSAPSKFVEFMDSGVELLDETRKDLAGKFRPPFEHLSYPSLPRLGKKPRPNSHSSDMSFCCIGETEATKVLEVPTKEIQALRQRQQQYSTRVSGEGTDPWSQAPPAACRLCRKPGVIGIRGLCNDCETDFIRPKTQKHKFSSSNEDEVKPTPPLKDSEYLKAKIAKMTKEVGARSLSSSHLIRDRRERQKGEGSMMAELKMTGTADKCPEIINPATRQKSHEAMLDGESDDDMYRSWQTPEMRAEYERTKSLFKRWSDCYETYDFEKFGKERGSVPLVYPEEAKPGTSRTRDSDFYEFYDDFFNAHGTKTTSNRIFREV